MGKSHKLTKKELADLWYLEHQGTIPWTKENKDRFRQTTNWLRFVDRVKKAKCDFCTCKGRTTLHHLHPQEYDKLDPSLFASLCWSCHTKVSQLSRRKDRSGVPEYFLPYLEEQS